MSVFSRRSTMFVAGAAMTLPLADGAANAAFDSPADDAAPGDEVSTSVGGSLMSTGGWGAVDSPLGHGAVGAGRNGERVNACAADAGQCATMPGPGISAMHPQDIPAALPQPLTDAAELAADADGVVSDQGRVAIEGSIRVPGEEIGGSADGSADGGSVTFDTPIGNGSTEVEGESFDILVD